MLSVSSHLVDRYTPRNNENGLVCSMVFLKRPLNFSKDIYIYFINNCRGLFVQ